MTLSTAGRLGIGTTTPVSKLDVKGKTTITQQAGENAALDINGGIRVSGANPAAFTVTVESSDYVWLDHPDCNNNPQAFILVTPVRHTQADPIVKGTYTLEYWAQYGKWYLLPYGYYMANVAQDVNVKLCNNTCNEFDVALGANYFFPDGAKFNVLVIGR